MQNYSSLDKKQTAITTEWHKPFCSHSELYLLFLRNKRQNVTLKSMVTLQKKKKTNMFSVFHAIASVYSGTLLCPSCHGYFCNSLSYIMKILFYFSDTGVLLGKCYGMKIN